ncbi:MAG: flagellar export protein FliJ, partial [Desulfotomaculales bacterium]
MARAQRDYQQRRESLGRTEKLFQEACGEPVPDLYDLAGGLHLFLYLEHLTCVRRVQEEEMKKALARIEECRTIAIEKRKDKLAMEKLRAKRQAAYRLEVSRTEQKELDEKGVQNSYW